MALFPEEEETVEEGLDLGTWRVARRCWSLWFVWPGVPGRPKVRRREREGLELGCRGERKERALGRAAQEPGMKEDSWRPYRKL